MTIQKCTFQIAGLVVLLSSGSSCNIHDNTINIPNATINATTDASASSVAPTQTVPVTVTVQNVYLVDPAVAPPPEHVNDAGHIQVYLDDFDTQPLLITAETMFNVTIPAATKPGPHELKCRVHKHDGTPTSTEMDVSITVIATIGADGGVDVVTSVDANVGAAGAGVGGSTGEGGVGGGAGSGG